MGRAPTRVTTQIAQNHASLQGSNKPLALTQPYEGHLLTRRYALVPWLGRDLPVRSLLPCSDRQLSEKDA